MVEYKISEEGMKHLATVLDAALKYGGVQILDVVNAVKYSLKPLPPQQEKEIIDVKNELKEN